MSATACRTEGSLKEAIRGSVISRIGGTPLFELRNVTQGLPSGVKVCVKAEHLNPGGSVKDRPARSIILDGLKSGRLNHDRRILDATSGNTGIAYAMIGAALGLNVTLCLPANASPERKRMLKAYGADLIETDPMLSTDGAQIYAKDLFERERFKYFYADQYNNDANWRSHYEGTGPEIWRQTDGRMTHFVAGLGTSGTFMGTSRRLKEYNPEIRVISMQPDSPFHGLEGMKHMESAIVPGIYDPGLADEEVVVGTEEAHEMTRRMAHDEGLFVGTSSGANVVAALGLAKRLGRGSLVVTVLCDSGNRYLGEEFWDAGVER